ncbi:hypothetical protein HGA88_00655, partial [Candidatus Roizmanbacteria bacterium]|nr:hypothetical protein [Candidatus Roizmanbacteria bacterium]
DSTSNPLKVVVGIEGRAPRYTKDISAPVSIIRNKPQESQPNRIAPATALDTILYVLPQRKTIMDEPTKVRHRSTPRSALVQQDMPPIKMPEIGSALEQAFQLKEHSSQRQSIITENEKVVTLKQEERQTHEATEHETMKEVNNVLSSTNKIATQTQSEKTTQQIQSENRVSAEVEATKNREAQTALSGVTGSQASASNPRNLTRQSTPQNNAQMPKQHQNSQPDSKDLGTHEAVSSVKTSTRSSKNTPVQKNTKQSHTHSSRTASRVTDVKQSVTISQGVAGVQSNTGMIIFEPNTLRQDFSQMLQYARKFAA